MVDETEGVSTRLRVQAHHQPSFPTTLLHLFQSYFNKRFWQALERQYQVR